MYFFEGARNGISLARAFDYRNSNDQRVGRQHMSKAIGLFLLAAMVLHLIRPLGLPGLRRRADFWKIAIAAFVIWTAVILLRDVV